MSGFLTNGVPNIVVSVGVEELPIDTTNAAGENPESGSVTMLQLATMLKRLAAVADHATVAGSRYYISLNIGVQTQITGIEAFVGTTGGTDKWIAELHDSTGALVATSDTAGATTAAASTWQQFPFLLGGTGAATPYLAAPGTYYIVIQSNGTTAKIAAYNDPDLEGLTNGSATGVFGTGAAITPPTTYTAGLGPMAQVYQ
jgi:hypothetical protein